MEINPKYKKKIQENTFTWHNIEDENLEDSSEWVPPLPQILNKTFLKYIRNNKSVRTGESKA